MLPRQPSQPAISVPMIVPRSSATSIAPCSIAATTPGASSAVLAAALRASAHRRRIATASAARARRTITAAAWHAPVHGRLQREAHRRHGGTFGGGFKKARAELA
jgi:hypothetical protein